MFGSSLQEIFSTISVGVISTICISFLIYELAIIFEQTPEKDFTHWWKESFIFSDKGHSAVIIFIVLVYALGQLVEDTSDKIIDDPDSLGSTSSFIAKKLKHEESGMRTEVFVDFKDYTSLTSIGHELLQFEELVRYAADKNVNHKVDIDSLLSFPSVYLKYKNKNWFDESEMEDIINSIYYRAKNWCYTQDKYYQDLELIQARIDFSRTLFVILIVMLGVSLLFLITQSMKLVYWALKNRSSETSLENKTESRFENDSKPDRKSLLFNALIRNGVLILIMLLLLNVTRFTYGVAEENFNKRTFGYYLSHLVESEQ